MSSVVSSFIGGQAQENVAQAQAGESRYQTDTEAKEAANALNEKSGEFQQGLLEQQTEYGQTTYQDKSVFQVDNISTDKAGVKLDGLRSSQGNIRTATKNYISENIFLRLPFAKSILFSRGKLTVIANHEFLFDRKERDRIISLPFENTSR